MMAVAATPNMARIRDAVREAARRTGDVSHVPRVAPLDANVFHAFALGGVPFVMVGLIEHWPIARLTPSELKERYGHLPVQARHGDYVKDAFTSRRLITPTTLSEFIDGRIGDASNELPPYLGNQQLPELNALCRWPPYYSRWGEARAWLGPAGTVTPLHCDYHDNLFAQIWGRKRFVIYPPHHDPYLYTREANPVLFGSPFDPDAPDYETYPLARQAKPIECVVAAGELLYLPAGWFHHVTAVEFSLSANRWVKDVPATVRASRRSVSDAK